MDEELQCAPGIKTTSGSCFSLKKLIKIAVAYNNKWIQQSSEGVKLDFTKIVIKEDKEYLLRELRKRLQKVCNDDEVCWIEQDFVKRLNDIDISKYTFRPKGPEGRFEWLSTLHIEDVLSQYEKSNPEFRFLGAVPMDFEDLPVLGLANIDYSKLQSEGVTKIGVVFNTDEHYKPGQHWIATYVDFDKNQVYFFDSVGDKPEKRVRRFLSKAVKFIMNSKKVPFEEIDINYNNVVHQRGNTECGVYSINFIIRLLNGETFDEIIKRRMTDKEVNACRKVYYQRDD